MTRSCNAVGAKCTNQSSLLFMTSPVTPAHITLYRGGLCTMASLQQKLINLVVKRSDDASRTDDPVSVQGRRTRPRGDCIA